MRGSCMTHYSNLILNMLSEDGTYIGFKMIKKKKKKIVQLFKILITSVSSNYTILYVDSGIYKKFENNILTH